MIERTTTVVGLKMLDLIQKYPAEVIYLTEKTRRQFCRSVGVTDLDGDVLYRGVKLLVLDDNEALFADSRTKLRLLHE